MVIDELWGAGGMVALMGIAWLCSTDRRAVRPRTVVGALALLGDDSGQAGAPTAGGFAFGGISLLIASGVALETMKQIDSQLMMRNYEGFLK